MEYMTYRCLRERLTVREIPRVSTRREQAKNIGRHAMGYVTYRCLQKGSWCESSRGNALICEDRKDRKRVNGTGFAVGSLQVCDLQVYVERFSFGELWESTHTLQDKNRAGDECHWPCRDLCFLQMQRKRKLAAQKRTRRECEQTYSVLAYASKKRRN